MSSSVKKKRVSNLFQSQKSQESLASYGQCSYLTDEDHKTLTTMASLTSLSPSDGCNCKSHLYENTDQFCEADEVFVLPPTQYVVSDYDIRDQPAHNILTPTPALEIKRHPCYESPNQHIHPHTQTDRFLCLNSLNPDFVPMPHLGQQEHGTRAADFDFPRVPVDAYYSSYPLIYMDAGGGLYAATEPVSLHLNALQNNLHNGINGIHGMPSHPAYGTRPQPHVDMANMQVYQGQPYAAYQWVQSVCPYPDSHFFYNNNLMRDDVECYQV